MVGNGAVTEDGNWERPVRDCWFFQENVLSCVEIPLVRTLVLQKWLVAVCVWL